jgi:hypothetical protein
VIDFCTSQGAAAIDSEAFENTVYQAVHSSGNGMNMNIAANQGGLGTKKKGPAKRLSKKERRHRQRVGKL